MIELRHKLRNQAIVVDADRRDPHPFSGAIAGLGNDDPLMMDLRAALNSANLIPLLKPSDVEEILVMPAVKEKL